MLAPWKQGSAHFSFPPDPRTLGASQGTGLIELHAPSKAEEDRVPTVRLLAQQVLVYRVSPQNGSTDGWVGVEGS